MIDKSKTVEVCAEGGKAVETAALCKPWKNQKAVFPPFAHRLENSPQKARVEFSTVPTASAARFLLKKETGEKRRYPAVSNRSWVEGGSESFGIWAGRPDNVNRGRLGTLFSLTSPFHRTEGQSPIIFDFSQAMCLPWVPLLITPSSHSGPPSRLGPCCTSL